MPNPLAKKTIAQIEKALEDDKTSAINEIIYVIKELASRAFSISITELAQLISRDPTITTKVISAANTLGFNPGGKQIDTISDAIHTVGFEKIRNLAISLMLAENAGKSLNSFEQKEMAALSVCSGMLAQNFSELLSLSAEPELIFVCASLRNYGKLLMSSFLVDKYREAKAMALEMKDDSAFEQVFGLTPLALGRYLLDSTTLPKSIMASLKEVPAEVLKRIASSIEEEILVVADLSASIASIAFDERIKPEDFNDALGSVIQRFQKTIPLKLDDVNAALVEVTNGLSQLNTVIGVRDDQSPSTVKLKARISGEPLPALPSQAQIKPRPKPKSFAEMNSEEREEMAENSFQKAIGQITSNLVPGQKVNLKLVYETASKTIMEGLDLESCIVFLREEFDHQSLSARYGFGKLFDRVKNRPLIAPHKKDIFSICLGRKEDILIQDTQAGKIRSVIPEWIHSAGDTSSLIVLPTQSEKRLFAIIIGTVSCDRSITLKEGDLRRLRVMRTHLASLKKMIDDGEVTAE